MRRNFKLILIIRLLLAFFSASSFADTSLDVECLFKDISTQELSETIGRNDVILLDARPKVFYELGHINTALNLSPLNFKEEYENLKKHIDFSKYEMVILYCSSFSCEDSDKLAKLLAAQNLEKIYIYKGGWDEWHSKKEDSK